MLPERTSEFQLIDAFRAAVAGFERIPLGIGDDTAIVEPLKGQGLLAADMLLEGVHFEFSTATPYQVGRKAMGVNLSDVAAMAGQPRFALVSLALPKDHPLNSEALPRELFSGLQSMAENFDTVIVGGDTNSWNGPLVINVAIVGESPSDPAVTRAGAKPGDWAFVTGRLGGSILGRHLDFLPRVKEASLLQQTVKLHSMIDISDGLIADLYHILEESHVGVCLDAESIPISAAARSMPDSTSALEHALGDGEDFELLFTVSADDGRRLTEKNPLPIELTRIGEIVTGDACLLRKADGSEVIVPRLGWNHAVEP